MAVDRPDWGMCGNDGCVGIQLSSGGRCLAHANRRRLRAELRRIGREGTVDARGVSVSAELLARILTAATRKDKRPALRTARFDGATFQDAAAFSGTTFEGEVRFNGACFERAALFSDTTFQNQAWFGGATFQGQTWFSRSSFHDLVWFSGTSFSDQAEFDRATFKRVAWFTGTTFQMQAWFGRATFHDAAWFDWVTFQEEAWFAGATVRCDARFDRADFQRARQVGPVLARQIVLDGAVFRERVQLELATPVLCARRTQFPAGVHLRLRFSSVVLDDANLVGPAILTGVSDPFPDLAGSEERMARGWERLPPGPRDQRWRPRLLSMCRADVAGLHLANVDLRPCRFIGTHNLDELRIESEPILAPAPGWWRARRKTLAEEQHWRASRPGWWRSGGWYPQSCKLPASPKVEQPPVLAPVQLAALYRDLRKGREDAKDEPGAADFYYGEMELRRRDRHRQRAERLVLWLYWLVSGYALRAWRAVATLAAVVLLAAIVFAFWGFRDPEPGFRPVRATGAGALVYEQRPAGPPPGIERLPEAIRFSARSATALLRGPERALEPVGEWLEIMLRFLGPVLLGLALLSVRGRVRR